MAASRPTLVPGTRIFQGAGRSSSAPCANARKRAVLALRSSSTSDMTRNFSPLCVLRRGERVGSFNELRQYDYAPRALHERLGADALHYLFEVSDVGGPDVHEGIRLTGHGARVRHFGVPPHRGADLLG